MQVQLESNEDPKTKQPLHRKTVFLLPTLY